MRVAVVAEWGEGGRLRPLFDDGSPAGEAEQVPDLAAEVARREVAEAPRWVWASTAQVYPALVAAGARVARCHDVTLTEALLSGFEGRWGEPRSLGAAWARLRGLPVPADASTGTASAGAGHGARHGATGHGGAGGDTQSALFPTDDSGLPEGADPLDALLAVHERQRERLRAVAADGHGLWLLAAAESAGALTAEEMSHDGLPWSPRAHDELLTELLGPRPPAGTRPRRLQDLADRIEQAAGTPVNPDSPVQLLRALRTAGLPVTSTRSWELRGHDHPLIPLVLEYKELARLWGAHGWTWLDAWVRDGRFRPGYVVGGVVSGRWATNGGGALQIPKMIRRAAVADPGMRFVVADAAQVEPRILAAISGDVGLAEAAAGGDLYAGLAPLFGGDRARAKIALLAAMYGQTSGDAAQLLVTLRTRFPAAIGYVDAAAQAGEDGRIVRSVLGRTCPPASAGWRETVSGGAGGAEEVQAAGRAARDRGRFTRNFVIQASAADWAEILLVILRRRLTGIDGARLVFFQHDEVVVHCPAERAEEVSAAADAAAAEARRLLFGDTSVRFPLTTAVVESYGDAK
ncbi:MAG: bifunctional 3'-5' exonuclease/DNA polymerase [Streptosporangiales bacterium]|nr:bifunctional 3'-5' exonuclease/DNA polymerase [Streptosporangiales bacterium]